MALASLWSGMALANAGLGAVHGFAGPLGGMYNAPHGASCAALLPHVMATNITALRHAGHAAALARFDHVAQLVTGSTTATADDGVAWVRTLCADLNVPTLGAMGVRPTDADHIVVNAQRASSMKGNPVVLGVDELGSMLRAAIAAR